MNYLFKRFLLLLWPLLGLLSGGCAVYERLLHPHRLPTPRMTPEAKAKMRATEKARHRGLTLPAAPDATAADATATDGSAPAADAATRPDEPRDKARSFSELPAGTRAKYDKHLLLKDSKPRPRRLHQYDTRPLTRREASRDVRRLRHYVKLPPPVRPDPAPRGRPAPLSALKNRVAVAPKKALPKTTRPAPAAIRAPRPTKPNVTRPAAEAVRAPRPAKPRTVRPGPEAVRAPRSAKPKVARPAAAAVRASRPMKPKTAPLLAPTKQVSAPKRVPPKTARPAPARRVLAPRARPAAPVAPAPPVSPAPATRP